MKKWQRLVWEVLAVVLLVPQLFLLLYHYRLLFARGSALGLLKALCLYGLTISWVSAPFLALLALLTRALVKAQVRWGLTLLACVAAGYLWVAAWNLLIFDMFSYVRAALPILLCSVCFAGYAAARALYRASLVPPKPKTVAPPEGTGEPTKSPAPDLSE